MRLTQEEIVEFKRLFREQVGEEISDERADELGWQLLDLFRIIYRPLPPGHRCHACSPEGSFDTKVKENRMKTQD